MSNTIFVEGNAGSTPELRHTAGGKAVTNFSVADTQRKQVDGNWVDAETTWFEVTAWEKLAEHVATHVKQGQRLTVTGRLETQTFDVDGESRKKLVLIADSVSLNLRFGLK